MKNPELCKKCFYGRIILNEKDELIGRSCELPMSTFIKHNAAGLYKNDTEDSCYDFIDDSENENKIVILT